MLVVLWCGCQFLGSERVVNGDVGCGLGLWWGSACLSTVGWEDFGILWFEGLTFGMGWSMVWVVDKWKQEE